MRNVLVIGPDPHAKGGMATVIAGTLNSADLARSFNLTMWPSYIDGPLIRRALHSCAREVEFRSRKPQADIYHVHTASGTSFWRKRRYIQALNDDAARAVLHVHGGKFADFWDSCSSAQRRRIAATFDKVGRVVVLSHDSMSALTERGVCSESVVRILPNAVTIPDQNETDYASRQVLFMGHLNENKSPDVLIRAAAIVLESFPDAHFVFAGDGNREQYEDLAADLGVIHACDFPGWVSGAARTALLRGSSIYCLPSRREAMPMGLLEAMSHGLIAVATSQGGIPSVVEDGLTGRLFEVGNYNELAEILCDLMRSVAMKRSLGKAGRARIQESFGMHAYVEKLTHIYEEVAS